DPELAAGCGRRVEDDLERDLRRSEALVVMGYVDRGLDPNGTVDRSVLDDLACEPRHRVGAGQHVARRHVHARESRKTPEATYRRNRDPGFRCELAESSRAHRALEVDVQVRLGQRAQISHRAMLADETDS